jgi:hypothetical protein
MPTTNNRTPTILACRCALAAAALLAPTGCASIVSGRHADVAINSNPPGANVAVHDRQGRMVASAQTPAVVSLKRGDGFLRKASYTATIEKPGYQTAQIPIEARLNPWLFGNVFFGGLVGLAVDPYTGAMWRPSPKEINQELAALDETTGEPELYQASHEVEAATR